MDVGTQRRRNRSSHALVAQEIFAEEVTRPRNPNPPKAAKALSQAAISNRLDRTEAHRNAFPATRRKRWGERTGVHTWAAVAVVELQDRNRYALHLRAPNRVFGATTPIWRDQSDELICNVDDALVPFVIAPGHLS